MAGSIDLSICIINHHTPALTMECVQSVVEAVQNLEAEIWVVNNTQNDLSSLATLTRQRVLLHIIQNDSPLGFAANQNQMLQRATGRYVMSLNSDTVVQADALHELVRFMDHHPRVGIAGPKLVHTDGHLLPSCRNFPTPATHFLEASGLWQLLRGQRLVGNWYYLCSPHTEARGVDWLTGACLIVRATAMREVGVFNAELFPALYGEDIEWCWRMRQAGWQIVFDPRAVVVHLENQSPLDSRIVQMYRGFYTFCAQYYPPSRRWGIRAATILALLPRWLLARSPGARATYAALLMLPVAKTYSAPYTRQPNLP